MPAYRIQIGATAFEGRYHTAANAVFGAMRFRENRLYDSVYEGMPKWDLRSNADRKEISRRMNAVVAQLRGPTHITVQEITDRKVPKKIHYA